jgi:carbonic anhydrase
MAPFRIPDLPMAERAAILQANQRYSESFGEKGFLPLPPARRIAILTCMDARLDPAAYAGLQEGDAHVIRNAGGRASDDAIRSLVISYKLLGTQEWYVIHHSLETAVLGPDGFSDVGKGPGSRAGDFIDWLTISDQRQSVVDDVRRIREHPLVPGRIPIDGFIYQVETGELIEIAEASAVGEVR